MLASPIHAIQAYRHVFPNCTYKTAAKAAYTLLKNPEIKSEISAGRKMIARRFRITAERTLREIAAVAFSDPNDLYNPDPANGGLPLPRAWSDVMPMARKSIAIIKVKRRRMKAEPDDAADW